MKTYTFKSGKYFKPDGQRAKPGDKIELNDEQFKAFKSFFEAPQVEEPKAKEPIVEPAKAPEPKK